jgi:CBS-domain-containing membrane protein
VGRKIAEVMTERPRAVTPQTSVRDAARLMEEEDVGSLPVIEDGAHLVGIVTDRDVAVRVVGRGLDPDATRVGEVASADVVALSPEQSSSASTGGTAASTIDPSRRAIMRSSCRVRCSPWATPWPSPCA